MTVGKSRTLICRSRLYLSLSWFIVNNKTILLVHTCTQVYRFSERNPTDVDYLCETDVSKCVWQQRRRFWVYNFPVDPLLAHVCTEVHRFSERNPEDTVYLCEIDVSKDVWQQRWRFWTHSFPVVRLLDHTCTQRWCFWTHSLPVDPLLDHTCTQVYRFSERNPTDDTYLCETDVSKCVWQQKTFLNVQLPGRPPPLSHMYTGASVLGTQPGRRYLPLRNWRI